MNKFEKWLRTVCFRNPTKEAHDLARSAWVHRGQEIAELRAELRRVQDVSLRECGVGFVDVRLLGDEL